MRVEALLRVCGLKPKQNSVSLTHMSCVTLGQVIRTEVAHPGLPNYKQNTWCNWVCIFKSYFEVSLGVDKMLKKKEMKEGRKEGTEGEW